MNQRSRELERQAESSANEVFDFDGRDWHDIVYEKFAQLVVKEMCGMMEQGARHGVQFTQI